MSIFKNIITTLRGEAETTSTDIVDDNETRTYTQEIRAGESQLTKAKRDLSDLQSKQDSANKAIAKISQSIAEHEGYASAALQQDNETLALEVAHQIAVQETALTEHQSALALHDTAVTNLKEIIKNTERQIADHHRHLSMAQTTQSVQKATAAITDNYNSNNYSLLDAKQSLERIKAKQQDHDARCKTSQQAADLAPQDSPLKTKLAQAGIETQSDATSVLARIKAKQGK